MLRIWSLHRLAEGIARLADKPTLHGDNGSTPQGHHGIGYVPHPGVKPWHSRLRVRDDTPIPSPCSEQQVRPEFTAKGFAIFDEARAWAAAFVRSDTTTNRHGGTDFVSPAQRHAGDDHFILAAHHALYIRAHKARPTRWSGATHDWSLRGSVLLN
jgi:putative transposase